ncbi:glycosyltransferase family 4 protein [Aeromonas salmonicida]|uniref:glycosyltransferase family 4 protein n=1 Tax=Aeromonas salmonicida TaxID=645 RepID=UPI00288E9CA7|nr:glycosyltransferase family 4 protein [Aeromonas salmonicida]
MKNKNLLVVTSELKFSGPNNVIKYLVNELVEKEEYITHLASLRVKSDSKYTDSLKLPKNKIYIQKGYSSLFHLAFVIFKLKPEVVNSHGIRADLFTFLVSLFIKFKHVSTVHNIPHQDYIMRYGRFLGNVMVFMHSFLFKSDRVKKIAVSKYARDFLIDIGKAKNVAFVYNGVCSREFNSDKNDNNLFPVGYSARILFCGHFSEIKNPFAVSVVATENPSYHFTMLGDGPLRERIESLAVNNISVMGRVTNVKEYLSEADVFIMPSLTEGMPMAIIEAMLMGLPIVCSDIPIFNELSKIPNIALFIFSNEIEGDFGKKINLALSFKVNNNRDIALKYFSSDVMMRGYVEVFNER